jgi:hypothetical protein
MAEHGQTMNLVRNEQTKLLAGALDRLSTVCVTVGVAAPLSNLSCTAVLPSPFRIFWQAVTFGFAWQSAYS